MVCSQEFKIKHTKNNCAEAAVRNLATEFNLARRSLDPGAPHTTETISSQVISSVSYQFHHRKSPNDSV